MRNFFRELGLFIRADYQHALYLPVFLWTGFFLALNYSLDFENSVLDNYAGTFRGFIYFFLFYSVGYFPVAIYVLLLRKKGRLCFNREFLWKTVFIIGLLALSAFFTFYKDFVAWLDLEHGSYFFRKVLINSRNVFMVLIPILLAWKFLKQKDSPFLWIRISGFKFKPFLIILLLMLPLVIGASFSDDFLRTYPTFKHWKSDDLGGFTTGFQILVYEIFYGSDFILIEMIFRGALVLGLYKLLGKDALLPMVSVYCFLHFGKPMGEAISSVFGGYILGILALQKGNITGGIILHLGVAWMMELFAHIQWHFTG